MMVIPQAAPLNLVSIGFRTHCQDEWLWSCFYDDKAVFKWWWDDHPNNVDDDGGNGDDEEEDKYHDDDRQWAPDDHPDMGEEYGEEDADDDGGRVDSQDVPHPFHIIL